MSKLFWKYVIQRSDGAQIDPNAQYFVLRIDTDPAARIALQAYINAISGNDQEPEFAGELQEWLTSVSSGTTS